MEAVNDRLVIFRKHLGMTQREIASSLSVNVSYYSDLENGRRNVTGKFLNKLAKNFGLSLDWIYTGNGEMVNKKANLEYPPLGANLELSTRVKKESLLIIDNTITNTHHMLKFHISDLLGRISTIEDETIDLTHVYKLLKNLDVYLENFAETNRASGGYEHFTLDDKISLLNELNYKLMKYLDILWDLGRYGEWKWDKNK